MKQQKKKLKLSIFEIVWYTLCALVFLWGLTYIVLGLIGMYAPIKPADNVIQQASDSYAKVFKMGFFPYGLIHVGVAAILALIVLLSCSKKSDREFEKEQRRAALRASARGNKVVENDDLVKETPVQEQPVPEQKLAEEPVEEKAEEEAPVEEEKVEEPAPEEAPVEEEKVEEPQADEVPAEEEKAEEPQPEEKPAE